MALFIEEQNERSDFLTRYLDKTFARLISMRNDAILDKEVNLFTERKGREQLHVLMKIGAGRT